MTVWRPLRAIVDVLTVSGAAVVAMSTGSPVLWSESPGGVLALSFTGSVFVVLVLAAKDGYRSTWKFSRYPEAMRFLGAGVLSSAVLWLLTMTTSLAIGLSTVILNTLLCFNFLVGTRFARRLMTEPDAFPWRRAVVTTDSTGGRRILVVGAGRAGATAAAAIMGQHPAEDRLVGFVDDDESLIGTFILGAPVLGSVRETMQLAEVKSISDLVLAIPGLGELGAQAEEEGIRVVAPLVQSHHRVWRRSHHAGSARAEQLLSEGVIARQGTILLTGGAGYIGSHLTRMLLDRGYRVKLLDRFLYGRTGLEGLDANGHLEIIDADISDSRQINLAVKEVDAVIALAAIVGDPACNLSPVDTVNWNYLTTKTLVEACEFYGTRRLVFASSCSVYGAKSDGLLSEESRLSPVSLYARTRILSENTILDRCQRVEPVILRLSTVFGQSPRMRYDLVVNTLTARAVRGERLSVFGGDQWRPNVHCHDAARAFLMAMEAPGDGVVGEVFNVGGENNNHQIRELAEIVASQVPSTQIDYRDDVVDRRDYRVSFSKIRERLGYEPRYSVTEGVREMAAAMAGNEVLQSYTDPVFSNVETLRRLLASERGAA